MTRIVAVDLLHVDLPPPVPRSDAIQSFVTQETPFVRVTCDDGPPVSPGRPKASADPLGGAPRSDGGSSVSQGIGYSYTIGTGGSSVLALLRDHLAPLLIGRDPAHIEALWRDLKKEWPDPPVAAVDAKPGQ